MRPDPSGFFWLFISCFFLFTSLLLLRRGFYLRKLKKLIENTKTSKICFISKGLVEVSGHVNPKDNKLVRAPFSGTECVYYVFEIARKSDRGWITTRNGSGGVQFFLQDNTGSVLVYPKDANPHPSLLNDLWAMTEILNWFRRPDEADTELEIGFEYFMPRSGDPLQRIKEFIIRNKIHYKMGFGFNLGIRFREYLVKPGDEVYVLGTVTDNPFIAPGGTPKSSEKIIIYKSKLDDLLLISHKSEESIIYRLNKDWKQKVILGGILSVLFFIMSSVVLLILLLDYGVIQAIINLFM
jgi:hypothetical protein